MTSINNTLRRQKQELEMGNPRAEPAATLLDLVTLSPPSAQAEGGTTND